ncbi:hypothetical protein AB1Y20_022218 [Prymnesium parvum]|uniref:Inositol-pentakisphosphate 2-kinase n=1 Tax=Prymnesium parvum TaxID=97485 RepID=A0AB34JIB4_PRYPA
MGSPDQVLDLPQNRLLSPLRVDSPRPWTDLRNGILDKNIRISLSVAGSSARLAFRLVDVATKEVVSVSESAEELARGVGYGARPQPWGAFLEDCLWGLPAVVPTPPEAGRSTANVPSVRDLASLWELEQLSLDEVPLLSLVAFLAAAAEMPEPRQLANELTLNWDELTGSTKPLIDGAQLLDAVDDIFDSRVRAVARGM